MLDTTFPHLNRGKNEPTRQVRALFSVRQNLFNNHSQRPLSAIPHQFVCIRSLFTSHGAHKPCIHYSYNTQASQRQISNVCISTMPLTTRPRHCRSTRLGTDTTSARRSSIYAQAPQEKIPDMSLATMPFKTRPGRPFNRFSAKTSCSRPSFASEHSLA